MVTGETSYYHMRCINLPILQKAILVSVNVDFHGRDKQSYLVLSIFQLLRVMEHQSLNLDSKKCQVKLPLMLYISKYEIDMSFFIL